MKITKILLYTVIAASVVFGGCKDKAEQVPAQKGMPEAHPKIDTKASFEIAPGSIKKADYTVEQCYTLRKKLKNRTISVRGKVVKFNADIMSRNWLHIQDGTGKKGTNDLTVTTINKAEVGQTVVVKGKLSVDKDFGANYKYTVILEGATVKVEK